MEEDGLDLSSFLLFCFLLFLFLRKTSNVFFFSFYLTGNDEMVMKGILEETNRQCHAWQRNVDQHCESVDLDPWDGGVWELDNELI